MSHAPLYALAALAALAVLAGGSERAAAAARACPATNPPNELVLAGGSPQTAQLDTKFDATLQVALANTNGCTLTGQLAGVSVEFDAPSSGASGTFGSTDTASATVGTSAAGVASAPAFTANETAGSYTVEVHSAYGSATLELSNTAAGVAASIEAVGATSQAAKVSSLYGQPLQAQIRDGDGNPVAGATVTFAVQPGSYGAGAAFLTGGDQASAVANSAGIATAPPLQANGSPGRFSATASTRDLSAVATYSLDNHAAEPTLTAAAAAGQATAGTRYPQPLTVRFLDETGMPIEGAPITFTLIPGGAGAGGGVVGGTFATGGSQAVVLTDATGSASSPPVVAGQSAGTFSASAEVSGAPVRVSFELRNLPPRLAVATKPLTAVAGSRYRGPLTVHVRDAGGRPVADAPVVFVLAPAANGAAASFVGGAAQATVESDARGRATSPAMVANTTAGTLTATASSGGKTIELTLTNRAGAPTALTAGAASGSSTETGHRLSVPLAVTVTDANGNPVSGVTVTFAAPRHGPSGTFTVHARQRWTVRAKSDRNGVALASPFTANHTAGGFVVSVRAGAARTAFALVNEAS
jgi:adhesin/invasin